MHHAHRYEQSVLARHRLNRGDGGDRPVEPLAARDQADGAGAVRRQRTGRVAGAVAELVDGLLHFRAGGVGDVGRMVDDAGDRLVAHAGKLRHFEH